MTRLVFALACYAAVPAFVAAADAPRTIVLDAPVIAPRACQAAIALDYQQRNTVAHVTGTIENPTCGAAAGNYELTITFQDEGGARRTLEVTEPWQRGDASTVSFTHDYEIGENVDLVSVRTRRIRCECAEAPAP